MHNGSKHMIFHHVNQLASTTRSNQHYQEPTGTNPRLRNKNWIQEMNQGLRGDGDVEDVDEDWPLKDDRVVGDDDGFDFPLREGSSPGGIAPPKGKSAPAQVLPHDGGISSREQAYDFSEGKTTYIPKDGHRRWPRRPQPTRARLGGLARPDGLCPPGGPLWQLLAPIFLIYYIKNLCEVSACLELCRIGGLTQLFQVQISSCWNSPSWCIPYKL